MFVQTFIPSSSYYTILIQKEGLLIMKACIIKTALSYLETPYKFNARSNQTDVFDCSSFTQFVYHQCGILLPRNSRQQFQMGTYQSIQNLEACDLLFFTTKKRKQKHGIDRIGHVAIYLGNGKMIHTYPKGKKVKISLLNQNWLNTFIGAKRVF